MPEAEMLSGRYLIYGLVNPRDRCLRYVGKTHKRREFRLAEHVMRASEGATAPLYEWIRDLLRNRLAPEIFVQERIGPAADWKAAECRWIARYRNWVADDLPYIHPPQTPKSFQVLIVNVRLLNVRAG